MVVAHNKVRALEQTAERDRTIAALEAQAEQWVGKLDAQDQGVRTRGLTLSDGGARARFYHAVAEAHLRRIIRVDLKSELFAYQIDEQALALARAMDSLLICWLMKRPHDWMGIRISRQHCETHHWLPFWIDPPMGDD